MDKIKLRCSYTDIQKSCLPYFMPRTVPRHRMHNKRATTILNNAFLVQRDLISDVRETTTYLSSLQRRCRENSLLIPIIFQRRLTKLGSADSTKQRSNTISTMVTIIIPSKNLGNRKKYFHHTYFCNQTVPKCWSQCRYQVRVLVKHENENLKNT